MPSNLPNAEDNILMRHLSNGTHEIKLGKSMLQSERSTSTKDWVTLRRTSKYIRQFLLSMYIFTNLITYFILDKAPKVLLYNDAAVTFNNELEPQIVYFPPPPVITALSDVEMTGGSQENLANLKHNIYESSEEKLSRKGRLPKTSASTTMSSFKAQVHSKPNDREYFLLFDTETNVCNLILSILRN